MKNHRKIVEQLLSTAGVRIDGPDPWDIQVRDERFYARVLKDGSLGLGESYMEGWWECARFVITECSAVYGSPRPHHQKLLLSANTAFRGRTFLSNISI